MECNSLYTIFPMPILTVLFYPQFPDLNPMIMRRFTEPGDVEKAYRWVMDSEGPRQTRILAETHCAEAIRHIGQLKQSPEQRSLIQLTDTVLNRMK